MPAVQRYLEKALEIARRHGEIASVILFGGLASGEFQNVSDVDLLLVYQMIEDREKRKLKSQLAELAVETGLAPRGQPKLLDLLENATGMFQSSFICNLADLEKMRFHRVFNFSSQGVPFRKGGEEL